MGLIDLKTNLKSLKFGKDKPGGGSSNQPYIQSDIPDKEGILPDSPDFLLRGGLKNPIDAATDVVRLGKYFIDIKSPSGLLFIAKQNLLSRNAVRTEASGLLNEFIYTPLSTLAQAGVNGIGLHFNKQGLNPIPGLPGSIKTYENSILNREFLSTEVSSNRLVSLYRVKIRGTQEASFINGINSFKIDPINLLEYPGGPGSILGIGKTRFKFSSTVPTINNQGKNLTGLGQLEETDRSDIDFKTYVSVASFGEVPQFLINKNNQGKTIIQEPIGLSNKYGEIFGRDLYTDLNKFYPESGSKHYTTKLNTLPGVNGLIYTPGENPTGSSGFMSSNEVKRDILSLSNFEPIALKYNKYFSKGIDDINSFLSLNSYKSSINGNSNNIYYTVNVGSINTAAMAGNLQGYVSDSIPPVTGVYGAATTNASNVDNQITYTLQDIINVKKDDLYSSKLIVQDFRKKLRSRIDDSLIIGSQNNPWNILSDSPNYSGPEAKNIEKRVELGDPGKPLGKNLRSYTEGYDGNGAAASGSYDRITTKPLYYSEGPSSDNTNDLVKFRIAAIDNDSPSNKVYIHFRAFLNNINDSYSSDWNSEKYVGRGENFYNYGGFDRKISLSFTVAAQSKIELIPMYKKLNYLASQLAPDYSKNGYMRGPLVTLTVGGYLYEQPGFITGLTYDMPEESPWEIGINDEGNFDSSVKELSHIIKVSNFSFTPIHNFVPKKADYTNLGSTPFIALSNGISNY
jgi:hypothetical protein